MAVLPVEPFLKGVEVMIVTCGAVLCSDLRTQQPFPYYGIKLYARNYTMHCLIYSHAFCHHSKEGTVPITDRPSDLLPLFDH